MLTIVYINNSINKMNDSEVIKDLRSRTKPYIGIMDQSQFSNTIIRQEAGLLKPKTLAKFLERFGYVKENGVWKESN